MWTTIALPMRQDIESIRLSAEKICASHAFTSIFLWEDAMELSIWLEPNGYLVRQGCRGDNHYFFPCGTHEAKARMLSMLPPDSVLHYADSEDLAFMEQWKSGGYTAKSARGDWEYLYDKEAQLELSGKPYRQIRRGVDKTRKLQGWYVEPLDEHNLHLAKALEEQWQELNFARLGEADNHTAINGIAHFYDLDLIGVLAFLDDKPQGYALGCLLNQQTFLGLTQRALEPSHFSGLRWELYNTLPDEVLTINLEEDMDLEGLRHNKTLMRPNSFNEVWDITLTKQREESK